MGTQVNDKAKLTESNITFGRKYKYTPTGFVGTATALARYHMREPQVMLEGNDSTGRPIEFWAAVQSVEFAE